MSFPLSLLYVAYLILVGAFALFSFFNLYHLLRFGRPVVVVLLISAIYLLGTATLLATTWGFLRDVDWSPQLQLLPTQLPGLN